MVNNILLTFSRGTSGLPVAKGQTWLALEMRILWVGFPVFGDCTGIPCAANDNRISQIANVLWTPVPQFPTLPAGIPVITPPIFALNETLKWIISCANNCTVGFAQCLSLDEDSADSLWQYLVSVMAGEMVGRRAGICWVPRKPYDQMISIKLNKLPMCTVVAVWHWL